MDVHGEELPRCYFHPRQIVVGICSLCLRERLLALAAKQDHKYHAKDTHRYSLQVLKGKLTIHLPRFFVLSSILHRLRFQHQRTNDSFNEGSVSSEDSFMSIKFDDDQHGLQGHESSSMINASFKLVDSTTSHHAMSRQHEKGGDVVEYATQPGVPRWHKRIGRLFKLARWKMATR